MDQRDKLLLKLKGAVEKAIRNSPQIKDILQEAVADDIDLSMGLVIIISTNPDEGNDDVGKDIKAIISAQDSSGKPTGRPPTKSRHKTNPPASLRGKALKFEITSQDIDFMKKHKIRF